MTHQPGHPSDVPPAGGGVQAGGGFAGGFSADHTITLDPETQATLAELREVDRGGYLSSDQWLPSNEGPQEIARLQTMLAEAGLLDLNELEHDMLGNYDDVTRSAFLNLLARSNAAGSTWEDTLSRLRQNPTAMSFRQPSRERAPFVAEVTNPEDIKRVIKETLREKIGRGRALDDAALDEIVNAYQGKQVAYQQARYDGAGTAVAPPDLSTFADIEAKRADPTAYDSRKVVDAADYLGKMLRGEV